LLLQTTPDFTAIVFSCLITFPIFIFGYIFFKKLEKGFADVI
jgi:ABC-type polysaccharide/polyol phosphate export permease